MHNIDTLCWKGHLIGNVTPCNSLQSLPTTHGVLPVLWKISLLKYMFFWSTCSKPSAKSVCHSYYIKSLPWNVFSTLAIGTAVTEGCVPIRHSLKKLCMFCHAEGLQLSWSSWQTWYFCMRPSTAGNKFHTQKVTFLNFTPATSWTS